MTVDGEITMQTSKSKRPLELVKSIPGRGSTNISKINAGSAPETCEYYRRIVDYANKIRHTDDVDCIINILDQACSETRALKSDSLTRAALAELIRAETRIEVLKKEMVALRDQSHLDHLTGALNRNGLEQAFRREAARANRQGAALGTALLDIDDVKKINDNYGHQVGDAALAHFAHVIKSTIRPCDVLVRFGGEEFLLLLPGSGQAQTAHALNRLQYDLSCCPLIHLNQELQITFSAGIAIFKSGETRDEIIARSDRALYQAKREGKNRVILAK